MTIFDELNPDEDSIHSTEYDYFVRLQTAATDSTDSTDHKAFARLQSFALEAEECELEILDAWVQGINEAIAWRREYFKLMERKPAAQELNVEFDDTQ